MDAKVATIPTSNAAALDGATPMIRQYIEIKSANPDSLLFYRMGDFYELFFSDAVEASRALGITLTKRGKFDDEEIPMCGVPVHAADDYLQKLIGLGFKVAVCEQMEDPAEAKKRGSKAVVRRDVVRLVTPGTITEENLLQPRESAYFASLARMRASDAGPLGDLALAWIDISTGVFEAMTTNAGQILADLARIEPKEIILPDGLFQDAEFSFLRDQIEEQLKYSLSPQPGSLFESTGAARRLQAFFRVSTLDAFGAFTRVELSAAAGALAYVEKTQINARPALSRPRRLAGNEVLSIDAPTRANLELTRTLAGEKQGTLLSAIDRTVTPAGGRLLADHLRNPLQNVDIIENRLNAVSFFLAEDTLREGTRSRLKAVPDLTRALSRLSLDRGGPRDLLALKDGLVSSRAFAAWLHDRESASLAGNAAPLPKRIEDAVEVLANLPADLERILSETLADEVGLFARDGGFVRSGCDEELDELRDLRDRSRQVIAGLQADYATESGVKNLKIKYNNVLGYFIETTALNAGALTDTDDAKAKFIHRQTLANAMRFTTTELAELESKIASAAGRSLDIELRLFAKLREMVLAEGDAIREASNAIAVLDVAASLGDLAISEGYCRPMVDNSMAFDITAGRHPVVEQALRRQAANPFVANDCDLGADSSGGNNGSIWLLTGPNMGGKSTFLRQNALIVILAQMGCFVPAGSAHIGVVDKIFSRVGAADDLARGRSTFMVEMVETAAILNQASERSFVILDEIGRGTATFDGLSIAWATLENLHEVNASRALFATHYHELTALSSVHDRLKNVTMAVKEWDGDVIFLHEVVEGAADRSYGIQVARLAGLPTAVVARARDVLDQLERANEDKSGSALIDDLPLFSASIAKVDKSRAGGQSGDGPIKTMLAEINPDDLTPREALEELYRLKTELDRK